MNRTQKLFLLGFILILIIVIIILFTTTWTKGDNNDDDINVATSVGLLGKFIYEKGVGVSSDYDNDIKAALKTWDEIIKDNVKVDVSFYSYSSNDDTLAFAFMNDEENIYSGGVVYINTYNKAETSMVNIIEHEIGHVLGIGTSKKWGSANNSTVLDKVIFPKTYDFYTSWEKGIPNKNGVPLGSNGYHFSEEVFDTELMTPYSEKKGVDLPLSGLTLNALIDIGWDIDLSKADNMSQLP
jgi:hypothetical protein